MKLQMRFSRELKQNPFQRTFLISVMLHFISSFEHLLFILTNSRKKVRGGDADLPLEAFEIFLKENDAPGWILVGKKDDISVLKYNELLHCYY